MIYTQAEAVRYCGVSKSAFYRACTKAGIEPNRVYTQEMVDAILNVVNSRQNRVASYRVIVLMTDLSTVADEGALSSAWVVKRSGVSKAKATKICNDYQDMGYLARVRQN